MSEEKSLSSRVVRFGVFEADLRAGELRRNGLKVKLQDHPFRVLALLLERPGEVFTREDLRERLWSADTFVEFDHSVNTAIRKIREALDDSSANPRYVETLPRRGYRFIGPVEPVEVVGATTAPAAEGERPAPPTGETLARRPIFASGSWRQTVVIVPWLLLLAAIGYIVWHEFRPPESARQAPLRKFTWAPGSLLPRYRGGRAVISPNGRHIVYVTEPSKLWIWDLNSEQPRELDGTDGAIRPFWSPDSQFIAFGVGRELKKIPVQGGAAVTLCQMDLTLNHGGSWSPDGRSIIFSPGQPGDVVYQVPAQGGEPKPLFELASGKGASRRLPQFLPLEAGARSILFAAGFLADSQIVVKNLETGEQKVLAAGNSPVYSPSGHVVYERRGLSTRLWALPFSIEALKPTGEAFPIAENAYQPSVSDDGTLVYTDLPTGQQQLVWRDRGGKKLGVIGQARELVGDPALSPDGLRVAFVGSRSPMNIWVHDITRGVSRPLAFGPTSEHGPSWTPSGKEVTFHRFGREETGGDIVSKPADGSGEVMLVRTPWHTNWQEWSPNEEYLVYNVWDPKTRADLWYLKRKEDNRGFESFVFLQTPFRETVAEFSPDGRYVAYVSDERGRFEIYVLPFPEAGSPQLVSVNGGTQPRWSRDSKELFYVQNDTLMAVAVTTAPNFSVGSTTSLFSNPGLAWPWTTPNYDVSSDGKRFVMVDTLEAEQAEVPTIRVVQNWFAEFRDRQAGE